MRLGIVGTGSIVRSLGPHLAEWEIEVGAISGTPRSVIQTERLADQLGVTVRYSNYHDLVADQTIDTVYVAVPNHLHYEVAEAAMRAGKDVICEKPLASNEREARRLANLAKKLGVFLWEAVVTTHQPNFGVVRDMLPRIGTVKEASVNFSQYSSRYDSFRAGKVKPVFNVKKSGGAIMDLGLYTITFTVGLFGEPKSVTYLPNIERGIDTSGLIVYRYDGFSVTNICAKDSWGSTGIMIQGTDGCIKSDAGPTLAGPVTLYLNNKEYETVDKSNKVMWEGEFLEFLRQQNESDFGACFRQIDQSVLVSRIQSSCRRAAGIIFPADEA